MLKGERNATPPPIAVRHIHKENTMENLACIAFVFAAYCLWACAAYCPAKTTAQADPVETFTPDLSKMGVRQLYKLASNAGIKGYKSMSKARLIVALGGLETVTIAA